MIGQRFWLQCWLRVVMVTLLSIGAALIPAGSAIAEPPTEAYPMSDPRASVGGNFKGELSFAYCPELGGYIAVGRGGDDGIWASQLHGSDWTPWRSLGGATSSPPTIASLVDPLATVCKVYVRGLDQRLWSTTVRPSLSTGPWQANPVGHLAAQPIIRWNHDHYTIAVLGTDKRIYTGTLTSSGVATWTGHGGASNFTPSLRAVYNQQGTYQGWCLSIVATDHAWWERCTYGAQANHWVSQGGYFTGAPGTYDYGNTYGYALRGARGFDGSLWIRSDKTGWYSLGGKMTTDPPGFGYSPSSNPPPWVGVLGIEGRTWQRTSLNISALSWKPFQRLGG